jgi:O-antigen/teichoic acid export membrane protein
MLETPLYVVGAWILIDHWGIDGAAVAWAIRVALDAVLLFTATFKLRLTESRRLVESGVLHIFSVLIFMLTVVFMMVLMDLALLTRIAAFVMSCCLLGVIAWLYALDNAERILIADISSHIKNLFKAVKSG